MVTRTRKGREDTVDIRPGIRHLSVQGPGAFGTVLHVEVATQPGVRPAELVAVFGDAYRRYQQTTPFLVPTPASIERFFATTFVARPGEERASA